MIQSDINICWSIRAFRLIPRQGVACPSYHWCKPSVPDPSQNISFYELHLGYRGSGVQHLPCKKDTQKHLFLIYILNIWKHNIFNAFQSGKHSHSAHFLQCISESKNASTTKWNWCPPLQSSYNGKHLLTQCNIEVLVQLNMNNKIEKEAQCETRTGGETLNQTKQWVRC